MKIIRLLVFLLLVSVRGFSAESSIELRGVIVGGGVTKLSLVDKATDTTRWMEVGQTFAGYKISAYDAVTATATLTKDGKELRLRMNAAQVKETAPGSSAEAPATTVEIIKAVQNNLRQICAAADQYYMESGKNSVTLAELVGPKNYIRELKPVDGESYSGLQLKLGSDPLTVATAHGVTVSYSP